MNGKKPIGIFDTGIGGLTTVTELQKLLPGEDIVYFGDSARNPYGNRPSDEIVEMTCQMLDFLKGNDVKAAGVACNTISTLLDRYAPKYDFTIVGVVTPVCEMIAKMDLPVVGVIATVATIENGTYQSIITRHSPNTRVLGEGAPILANLIDRGDFSQEPLDAEIRKHMDHMLADGPIGHVILGCTHYPIVQENFERLYPSIEFINPAYEQALALRDMLTAQNGLNDRKDGGKFTVCTSGDPKVYADVCKRLDCKTPTELRVVKLGLPAV